jgi:hypothetical protein
MPLHFPHLKRKHEPGHVVLVAGDKPIEEQVGNQVGFNMSVLDHLNDDFYAVDKLSGKPEIFQIKEGEKHYTGYKLVEINLSSNRAKIAATFGKRRITKP